MKKILSSSALLLVATLLISSCKKDKSTSEQPSGENLEISEMLLGDITVKVNPFGRTPLAASLGIASIHPTKVEITVMGNIPVEGKFETLSDEHTVPVLGLYANTNNKVLLKLTDNQGNYAYDTLRIQAPALATNLPTVKIDVVQEQNMEPGMHLCGLHLANNGKFNSQPIMFDNNGEIRWHLNLGHFDKMTWPIQRLKNGNLYFTNSGGVYEFSMLGEEINHWPLPGYRAHHDIIEMPNGNFLVSVQKYGTQIDTGGGMIESTDDFIIEVSREGGAIVKEWDLRQILDVDRFDFYPGAGDWFHMNALWYSESDNTIIISGRNQGVIKVDWENNLMWILSPHTGWGKSGPTGNGAETAPFLLDAVDGGGTLLPQNVQDGSVADANFEWAWGQHAPMLMPNGNIILFDNGFNRRFGAVATPYSRAVEYKIDEANMTVSQVWSYGENRGPDAFSAIISDVDLMEQTGNVLFMPGIIGGTPPKSKIIEIAYPAQTVVFESNLEFKNVGGSGVQGWGQLDIMYRAERMKLY